MQATTKNICTSLLILAGVSFSSCSKFLEEEPKSFLAPENYYKTAEDAFIALTGAYDALGSGGETFIARRLQYLTWFASDEALPPTLTAEMPLDEFSYVADNDDVSRVWNSMYAAINTANIVIDRVANISMDETLKTQYIAEARFLRALSYFYGVRLWGDLPLVAKEVTAVSQVDIARSPISEVYDLIVSDLEFAGEHLAPANQNGRARKGAAKALLAKVYLTRASSVAAKPDDYQKCADMCNETLAIPEHTLLPDYEKAIGGEDEFNKESLFEWQGDRVLNTSSELNAVGAFCLPRGMYVIPTQTASDGGSIGSEVAYFNRYPDNDYRKECTFYTVGPDKNGNPITWQQLAVPYPSPAKKYVNKNATTRDAAAFSGNFVLLRLSDVYLMRAEALNEISAAPTADAYTMINAIRGRARKRNGGTPSATPADLAGLTKEAFRDSVLNERVVELGFEGHRWFDLVRTKRLVATIKAVHPAYPVAEKHLLFPIPANEIKLNPKIEQNPLWK
ncbi:RagB/SusD family nutrient uptake outer membrane protein [Chitinophaga sp. SYP-B3965]|uniref:RagB/SusD family nutrient uptake outer membrane protein n=1 Tax=Chitinophaga sp. SYP-B3965 TaxID=2663120 RepID=UPI001299E388|nr:RagB/SusD family nutrient uptake outer membrane protein [Chitinophaga sp. SYP-B3965]MRG44959.1 RagB/SusD family nutrient uptake outer membrane protein [Chitinophaga sp. SYP-B3965]